MKMIKEFIAESLIGTEIFRMARSIAKYRDEIDTNDDYIWGLYNKLYYKGYDLDDKETYDSFIILLHKFQDEILKELVDILASKKFSRIMSFTDKL